jgi:hypothetical protein
MCRCRPSPAVLAAGKTVGFISNGKEGTRGYFTQLDLISVTIRTAMRYPQTSLQ